MHGTALQKQCRVRASFSLPTAEGVDLQPVDAQRWDLDEALTVEWTNSLDSFFVFPQPAVLYRLEEFRIHTPHIGIREITARQVFHETHGTLDSAFGFQEAGSNGWADRSGLRIRNFATYR